MALALHWQPDILSEVFLDERCGGFAALGTALASGRPGLVLTTSGTATVNLHPAVAEADAAGVPLIALTADRPPELHGVGAPQTIDQADLFGSHARRVFHFHPSDGEPSIDALQSLATDVWRAAVGEATPPGPVQCNLAFREPLWSPDPLVRPALSGGVSNLHLESGVEGLSAVLTGFATLGPSPRILVVADGLAEGAPLLQQAAAVNGWTLLTGARAGVAQAGTVTRSDALLRAANTSPSLAAELLPDVVLRWGQLPASKVLGTWLDGLSCPQFAFERYGRRFDPGRSLSADPVRGSIAEVLRQWRSAGLPEGNREYAKRWIQAEEVADTSIQSVINNVPLSDPVVARMVSGTAMAWGATLVVGSSMPIRDVEWYGHRVERTLSNRGANGIDGTISTAIGVALTGTPTIALMGDLTFLHDSNALIGLGSRSDPLDLVLVVVDNGGGGIFHFLPQHDHLTPEEFEELFGTPHDLNLVELAIAFGVAAVRSASVEELRGALATARGQSGVRMIVVPTDRQTSVAVHDQIHEAVAAAIAGGQSA